MGYKNVDSDLFANHVRYFRNALVRANYVDLSRGIFRTKKFLMLFLSNLLLKSNDSLKNREMHILADTVKTQNDTVNDTLLKMIKQNNKIAASEINERLKLSLSTVRRKISDLKISKKIEHVGSDKTGYWRINE